MTTENIDDFNTTCPLPLREYPNIQLAHGGGGRLMQQLIDKMFAPAFSGDIDVSRHDAAVVEFGHSRLAFTTDSYVVQPLIFPGGDIGQLAVNGTVNDLSMSGARPLYLSLGMILEEGVPMKTVWQITQSIAQAAKKAEVSIITGDTKVVDKGKGDQIYINTAGIGILEHNLKIDPLQVQVGDVILLNGDIGRHGMAVMAMREGLEFESQIESDSMPLSSLVLDLIAAGINIHCLRDLTRGGLASALNEIAVSSPQTGITIDEAAVPVRDDVSAACEFLGLDPLYVANEGRFICIIPENEKELALNIMNGSDCAHHAGLIGHVNQEHAGIVQMKSRIGAQRILDMLSGEQLPRIC